jgi:branched-chain amino acid transport system substrate-binding protein
MPQAGMDPTKIPLAGPDGIQDGPATTEGAFLNIAGDARVNTHSTVAAIGEFPAKADFDQKFKALFANDGQFANPGAYSGPAYACAQVIIQSLRAVVDKTEKAGLREAVRAHATGGNEFDTILGKIKFDQNGDSSQKIISFYKEQNGAWAFAKQQDFGQTASK